MRPTREGRHSPFRLGLVTKGIGVDPDVPDVDPEPPINWAASSNQGQAFIPVTNATSVALVQSKTGTGISGLTLTLDFEPTIGNLLVVCVAEDADNGPTFTLDNGTWTQVNSTVFSGNGTNWPNRMYYQIVDGATSTSTTIVSSSNNAAALVRAGIIELSGVDTLTDTGSATNTSSTTDTVTPTAALPAILISATFGRNNPAPALSPAGSMTELVELAPSTQKPFAINYQVIDSASGSYTVGSTGASANSSMIAAAFTNTGDSTVWIDAPFAIDGSDSTFENNPQEQSPFLRHTLFDSYLIDRGRLVVSWTSNTSRTITLQGANEADYSDATTLDTHTYSPTGGLTNPDTLDFGWTPTSVYKYFQYLTTVENWYRVYESSLYQAGVGAVAFSALSSNTLALGGVVVGNSAASNYHFVATSATTGLWLPHTNNDDEEEPVEVVTASGSAITLNYDVARVWDVTLTANCTFTITNPPADQLLGQLIVILRQGGSGSYTVTWPASVQWRDSSTGLPTGSAPTLPTAVGSQLVVTLSTVDGGVTWGGSTGDGSSLDYGETADIQSVGSNNYSGVSLEVARADHIHDANPALLTSMGVRGELLLSDTASSPPVYGDILVNDDNTDFLYADLVDL